MYTIYHNPRCKKSRAGLQHAIDKGLLGVGESCFGLDHDRLGLEQCCELDQAVGGRKRANPWGSSYCPISSNGTGPRTG